jgi:arylsulfatase A-like enzyme
MPGGEDTYQSYGTAWANLSNTPFRLYKHWVHEGGIATPLIVHWPRGIKEAGGLRHNPGQLPDIMATILEVAGAEYPREYGGKAILPCAGESLVPSFTTDGAERGPLFWEHEGNAAVRIGKWKLVRNYPGPWELYDMDADRTETHDLAAQHPEKVREMSAEYAAWAERCGVIPREKILELMQAQAGKAFWEDKAK